MAQVGWFPRFAPNNTRTTWERDGYWQAQWLDETREIAHGEHMLIIDGASTTISSGTEIGAGGGKWATCFPIGPTRVVTSWGDVFLGAGCPTLNPAGLFGYVDDRQAMVKNLIWNNAPVSRGSITDVRASRTALVWSSSGRTWGLRLDAPGSVAQDIQAAPAEFVPVPIDTPTGPWVLSQTHVGLVLRPFGETIGYRFDNNAQAFGPDATWDGAAIATIFTNSAGVQSMQRFDLSAPRVPLNVAAPPVPTPTPTPTPPTPPTEPVPMPSTLPFLTPPFPGLLEQVIAALAAVRSSDDPQYWVVHIEEKTNGNDWQYWVDRINIGDGVGKAPATPGPVTPPPATPPPVEEPMDLTPLIAKLEDVRAAVVAADTHNVAKLDEIKVAFIKGTSDLAKTLIPLLASGGGLGGLLGVLGKK